MWCRESGSLGRVGLSFAPRAVADGRTLITMRLGERVLVRAVDAGRRKVREPVRVGLAVATAELVELAVEQRIALDGLHLAVEDRQPIGHVLCDAALAALAGTSRRTAMAGWITKRGDQHLVNRYTAFLERQGVLRVQRPADGRRLARVELVNRTDELNQPRAVHEAYELLTHAAGLAPAPSQSPPARNTPMGPMEPTDRTPGQTALAIARFGARLVADPPKTVDWTDYSTTASRQGNWSPWGFLS
jgi:hypothetical protein